MATFIKTDGSAQDVQPAGEKFKLEELQGYVGGYIEALTLPTGEVMVLNEEGKLKGLPFNGRATAMARSAGIADSDFIVGDVLIVQQDDEGEWY